MTAEPGLVRLRLVSIPAGDGVQLDGLLYEPAGLPARGSVLLMHGNVGNFYSGPSRFLPPVLVRAGFGCLAFNRRGHDVLVNRVGRGMAGGAFQSAEEGMADNVLAAAFLAGNGYPRPAVVGHSNGGLLAAQFAAHHPGDVSALVLLSAHAGGPQTYARSCASGLMAAEQADELERRGRALVAAGRGDELLLMPRWWYVISAASLVDRIDRTPGLLAVAPSIRCPTLAVRGSLEPASTYPMEEFAAQVRGPASAHVIEGSDHWYRGCESEVAELVAGWLSAQMPPCAG